MTVATISPATLVGAIATEHPLATRVFARHGIDFCCGGGRPLADACRDKGVDVDLVVRELQASLTSSAGPQRPATRWDDAPLSDLIQHILTVYHAPLKEELPRLEAMARKVHQVHGEKDPVRIGELLRVYLGLKAELDAHLLKEERILFPMILRGHGQMAQGPVAVMEDEHATAGAALAQLRALTNGYQVPEGACNTWRALWHGLEAFERDLHEHIHLENNILFPRALQ